MGERGEVGLFEVVVRDLDDLGVVLVHASLGLLSSEDAVKATSAMVWQRKVGLD